MRAAQPKRSASASAADGRRGVRRGNQEERPPFRAPAAARSFGRPKFNAAATRSGLVPKAKAAGVGESLGAANRSGRRYEAPSSVDLSESNKAGSRGFAERMGNLMDQHGQGKGSGEDEEVRVDSVVQKMTDLLQMASAQLDNGGSASSAQALARRLSVSLGERLSGRSALQDSGSRQTSISSEVNMNRRDSGQVTALLDLVLADMVALNAEEVDGGAASSAHGDQLAQVTQIDEAVDEIASLREQMENTAYEIAELRAVLVEKDLECDRLRQEGAKAYTELREWAANDASQHAMQVSAMQAELDELRRERAASSRGLASQGDIPQFEYICPWCGKPNVVNYESAAVIDNAGNMQVEMRKAPAIPGSNKLVGASLSTTAAPSLLGAPDPESNVCVFRQSSLPQSPPNSRPASLSAPIRAANISPPAIHGSPTPATRHVSSTACALSPRRFISSPSAVATPGTSVLAGPAVATPGSVHAASAPFVRAVSPSTTSSPPVGGNVRTIIAPDSSDRPLLSPHLVQRQVSVPQASAAKFLLSSSPSPRVPLVAPAPLPSSGAMAGPLHTARSDNAREASPQRESLSSPGRGGFYQRTGSPTTQQNWRWKLKWTLERDDP